MTDHELLEMAAKAAGIDLNQVNGPIVNGGVRLQDNWNPITKDGDAFKLVVDLQLDIAYSGSWVFVSRDEQFDEVGEAIGADARAATRKAIVRAAAEIGRSVK